MIKEIHLYNPDNIKEYIPKEKKHFTKKYFYVITKNSFTLSIDGGCNIVNMDDIDTSNYNIIDLGDDPFYGSGSVLDNIINLFNKLYNRHLRLVKLNMILE